MNNFLKTADWLKLSLGDFDTAIRSKEEEDYDASVFYIQQCLEKSCKAILCFLGIEVRKTHFPASEIIKNEILDNSSEIIRLSLNQDHIELLKKIVENSIPLEEQETIPRYGLEWEGRIILPSEIYDKEKTDTLFVSAKNALLFLCVFFEKFNIKELNEVLENVRIRIEKLK